jgi:hypothetical protein
MMMISSVVLSIFASWGLQNDNGEDNSNAHARSSPQVRGVARIFGRPFDGDAFGLSIKISLRNAREWCRFPVPLAGSSNEKPA